MKLALLVMAMMAATSLHAGRPIAHTQYRWESAGGGADPRLIEVPDSQMIGEYQDWEVLKSSSLISALTRNDAGSLFGRMCDGESCTYYLNATAECDAGQVYPGLINGSNGAMGLTLRCAHIKEAGEPYAILLIDEDLSDELADTDEISITIPLANGGVATSRFSMAGAADAQQDMLDNAGEDRLPAAETI
ncbi:hypothetical protein [Sphingomonas sp.]|uniref:hypothetical protein n=1 Tax=Sphingomonas sp. TaxID=28214 RepID=UPI003B3AE21F